MEESDRNRIVIKKKTPTVVKAGGSSFLNLDLLRPPGALSPAKKNLGPDLTEKPFEPAKEVEKREEESGEEDFPVIVTPKARERKKQKQKVVTQPGGEKIIYIDRPFPAFMRGDGDVNAKVSLYQRTSKDKNAPYVLIDIIQQPKTSIGARAPRAVPKVLLTPTQTRRIQIGRAINRPKFW